MIGRHAEPDVRGQNGAGRRGEPSHQHGENLRVGHFRHQGPDQQGRLTLAKEDVGSGVDRLGRTRSD